MVVMSCRRFTKCLSVYKDILLKYLRWTYERVYMIEIKMPVFMSDWICVKWYSIFLQLRSRNLAVYDVKRTITSSSGDIHRYATADGEYPSGRINDDGHYHRQNHIRKHAMSNPSLWTMFIVYFTIIWTIYGTVSSGKVRNDDAKTSLSAECDLSVNSFLAGKAYLRRYLRHFLDKGMRRIYAKSDRTLYMIVIKNVHDNKATTFANIYGYVLLSQSLVVEYVCKERPYRTKYGRHT